MAPHGCSFISSRYASPCSVSTRSSGETRTIFPCSQKMRFVLERIALRRAALTARLSAASEPLISGSVACSKSCELILFARFDRHGYPCGVIKYHPRVGQISIEAYKVVPPADKAPTYCLLGNAMARDYYDLWLVRRVRQLPFRCGSTVSASAHSIAEPARLSRRASGCRFVRFVEIAVGKPSSGFPRWPSIIWTPWNGSGKVGALFSAAYNLSKSTARK